jgi:hypothetical protein
LLNKAWVKKRREGERTGFAKKKTEGIEREAWKWIEERVIKWLRVEKSLRLSNFQTR